MLYLSSTDVAGALYGLGRLLRFDRTGIDYFDATVPGFIKSYWVAAAVLPLYVVKILAEMVFLGQVGVDVDPFRYLIVQVITYVIDWVAFPLAVLMLADSLGFSSRVFHFLVPLNWLMLVAYGVLVPLKVVSYVGLLPLAIVAPMETMAIGLLLVYITVFARHGLQVPWWSAGGVMLLNLFLGFTAVAIAAGVSGLV